MRGVQSVPHKKFTTYISPWSLYLMALFFLGLWFAASFWHGRYTWGLDYLRYYPVWLRIMWFVCGAGLLLFATLHCRQSTGEEHSNNHSVWHLLGLLVVVIVFAIVLRNKIPLLGDSTLRINETASGRLFSTTQPLTTVIHGLLYRLIVRTGQSFAGAKLSYIIVSVMAGLGVTVVYYSIAEIWFNKVKWFCVLFLLSLGLNQIFYGYGENYALFMFAVWCYLWFGLRSLEKKARLYSATLSCSFAIACNTAGLLLVPSLAYLWWHTLFHKREIDLFRVLTNVLLLMTGPVFTLALGWLVAGQEQFTLALAETPQTPFLPLWQGTFGDGILSLTHLTDLLNQLLLVISGALFILIALLFSQTKTRADQRLSFLLSALLGAVLFILAINPRLGAPRDWDLFAWVGIPFVFLALLLLKERKNYKRVLEPAAVLSIWFFWPWIGVNASADLSINRYLTILENDTKFIAYGYENLATYYRKQNQIDKFKWACRKGLERESTHPRMLFKYGTILYQQGKLDSAAKYLKRAVKQDSMKITYWNNLASVLNELNQPEEAYLALQRSLALDSSNIATLYSLGLLYHNLARWTAADSTFFLARKYGYNSEWLYFYWGKAQLRSGQFEKAKQNLNRALDLGIQRDLVMPLYEEAEAGLNKIKGLKPNR